MTAVQPYRGAPRLFSPNEFELRLPVTMFTLPIVHPLPLLACVIDLFSRAKDN